MVSGVIGVLPTMLVGGLALKMTERLFPEPTRPLEGKRSSQEKVVDRFIEAMRCADSKREEKDIQKMYTNELVKLGLSRKEARKELKYWWDVYTFRID